MTMRLSEDDQNVDMGDGEEKVDEDQDFDMEDLNAEKRDFGEKDEADDYINREREEVEKINNDKQEEDEIQSGNINIRKFKMGRVVFGSTKTLPANPCMIGDAQPDLVKILLLQIGATCTALSNTSNGIFATIDIRQKSDSWSLWRQCSLFFQERKLPENYHSGAGRSHLCVSTPTTTNCRLVFDLAKWEAAPSSNVPEALQSDWGPQLSQAARWSTTKVGIAYDRGSHLGDCGHSCVPPEAAQEIAAAGAKAKAKPVAKPTPKPVQLLEHQHCRLQWHTPEKLPKDQDSLQHLLREEAVEEITVERVVNTLTEEETGTTQGKETDGTNIEWPLHRSRCLVTSMQSVLMIGLFVMADDFWQDSEPANFIFLDAMLSTPNDASWATICSSLSAWLKGRNVRF